MVARDASLYAQAKRTVVAREPRSSAYRSARIVREYKRLYAEKYGADRPAFKGARGPLSRWFREEWVDACKLPRRVPCGRAKRTTTMPYCRPLHRVSAATPATVGELGRRELAKRCARKHREVRFRLLPSSKPAKKWMVDVETPDGKPHRIHFGSAAHSDFTMHRDEDRKRRYLQRHAAREDWTLGGLLTPGFWSRWLLWNRRTLEASVRALVAAARRKGVALRQGH